MNTHLHRRAFQHSLSVLTRLPVGGYPYTQEEMRWAPAYFPAAGAVIGLLLAAVHVCLIGWGLTALTASAVTVMSGLALTGAFHEDGLADSADALGGGHNQASILRILKDSRIGTFGAAALSISLIVRTVALASLPIAQVPAASIVIEALSRVPPVIALGLLPYVTQPTLAKFRSAARSTPQQGAVAAMFGGCLLVLSFLCGQLTLVGILGIMLVAIVLSAIALRTFIFAVGGVTGDFLGALQQCIAIGLWVTWHQ